MNKAKSDILIFRILSKACKVTFLSVKRPESLGIRLLRFALILAIYQFSPKQLCAQNTHDIYFLRSKGAPPEDFKSDIEKKSRNVSSEWKKAGKKYNIQSSHFLNQLLSSGKVIYGDTLTVLINRIADRLLSGQPELRRELRFYTLRSTVPNAMCLQQGIILVTTGLIASFKSESELAFVISHEISHYQKRHSLKFYNFKKSLAKASDFNAVNLDNAIRKIYAYSREHEIEADEVGLIMYLKAGYKPAHAINALNKLHHWDQFYEGYNLNKSLEDDSIEIFINTLDDSYAAGNPLLDRITENIKNKELSESTSGESPEYSTHPSLSTRIEILKKISTLDADSVFNADSSGYSFFRNLAIFDIAFLAYLQSDYIKSYYLLEYLYNRGINSEKTKMLRFANIYRFVQLARTSMLSSPDDYKWELNQQGKLIFRLLKNCGKPENLYKLQKLCYRLYEYSGNVAYMDLSAAYHDELRHTDRGIKITDSLMSEAETEKLSARRRVVHSNDMIVKKNRNRYLTYNKNYRPAENLMLFIPSITEIVAMKKLKRDYLSESRAQNSIYTAYQISAKSLDMHTTILDNRLSDDFTTIRYNQFSMATEWMEERLSIDSALPIYMYTAQNLLSDSQISKAQYISAAMLNYIVHPRQFNPVISATMVIFYPTIPVLIAWAIIPQKDLYAVNLLVNVKNGQIEYLSYERINARFRKDLIRGHAYKTLYNYKHGVK